MTVRIFFIIVFHAAVPLWEVQLPLPIFRRRHSHQLFKCLSEIIPVTVSYPGGDIRNLVPGIGQQLFCLIDSEICQILVQGLTRLAFEKRTDIGGRKKYMLADIFNGQRFVLIVIGDKLPDQLNRGMILAPIVNPGKEFFYLLFQ